MSSFQQSLDVFLDITRRAERLSSSASLLSWDMQTIMPKKAGPVRALALGAVQAEVFRITTSDEYGYAMQQLAEHAALLTAQQARMLELANRHYTRFKKIPTEEYEAYMVATSQSEQAWREAKQTNNFALFAPHLQKMIDYNARFAELWGYENTPYDALLAEYDPALLTADIDPVFAKLLEGTQQLLKKAPNLPALKETFVEPDDQKHMGEYLLRAIGYDLDAGNLYETEHPFTSTIHRGDIRVTTKYVPNNSTFSLFSVVHEGGHGIYAQNISDELDGTNLFEGTSMGIHESQSRFYENMVARNFGFWHTHFDDICKLANVRLAPDAHAFWRGINRIEPSLIRTEADELTYNLHIIIRYEIERAIFAQKLKATDLPNIWNAKYEEYLGIKPQNDVEGILQDVHWSGGMFGYFPSYSIGNICAAQFAAAMQKNLGHLDELVRTSGGLCAIGTWLRDNVQVHGALYTPADILLKATGKGLDPSDFLSYMEAKMAKLAQGM